MIGFLIERLVLQKLWRSWRSGINSAVVPGSGGVAFLGDSITHGGRWDLLLPTVSTRNFGISGERTDHLLTRLEPLIALQPKKLFILIGTNDLTKGVGLPTIAQNVDQLIARLKNETSCEIYLQSVLPRAKKFAERIKSLNELYRNVADKHAVTFVNLYPLFDNGEGQLRAELTDDELHLLGPGYDIWRKAIHDLVSD